MKALIFIIAIALASYIGYVVWLNQTPVVAVEDPEPIVVAVAVATPEPKVAVPPPPARVLAPDGTFWLIQRIAVTTDAGVTAIPVGTKLTMVADEGQAIKVTDGKREFSALKSQLTNDLAVARQAFSAYQAAIQAQSAQSYKAQPDPLPSPVERAQSAKSDSTADGKSSCSNLKCV